MDHNRLTTKSSEALDDAQAKAVRLGHTEVDGEHLLEALLKPAAREKVMAALRSHFPPEFLNRIDDIVLFKPLTLQEVEQTVDLMTDGQRQRLGICR
jgi:ATP-dependent Clp protease ATP-binding subunit ClpB